MTHPGRPIGSPYYAIYLIEVRQIPISTCGSGTDSDKIAPEDAVRISELLHAIRDSHNLEIRYRFTNWGRQDEFQENICDGDCYHLCDFVPVLGFRRAVYDRQRNGVSFARERG